MGKLIMMPVSKQTRAGQSKAATQQTNLTRVAVTSAPSSNLREMKTLDLSIWESAPRERTLAYFPTYSAVSRAIQAAMRGWVRDWFDANPDILLRPNTAYPILVYICTHPFSGKPTNMFTYDIQQTEALDRAFSSAAIRLAREMKQLKTQDLSWFTREHYFAYRSKEVLRYVINNRRYIYKMLNVETMLMDAILKFSVIDIPALGLATAEANLRRAFTVQLHRFSEEFDLAPRVGELLQIATDALKTKLAQDRVMALPLAA